MDQFALREPKRGMQCGWNDVRWHRAVPAGYKPVAQSNDAYFARADRMLQLAAKHGFLVVLDPAETSSSLPLLRRKGLAWSRAYGNYLGTRYKDVPNIVWMSGADFQTWQDPT